MPSVNPYASPQLQSVPVTHDVYFSTATKKLSFREYWWLAKNPLEFVFGVAFKFQCERGVFVQLTDHELQRLAASTANPPPPGTVNPGAGWAGTLAWIVLLLGLFLIMQGPPVNQRQWFFRIAVLALGMVGVVASWAVGHLRASRARDGARSRS